jgi:protein-S-isoprenylcysteine O-methyltransferase Ste14
MDTQRASKLYGLTQSALLCLFAAAVFFGLPTPRLLAGEISRFVGNILCAAGLLLLFAAITRLGRAIQIDPSPRTDATLVTAGIYKWLRHPIYTAIVVMVIGLFLRRATLQVAVMSAIVIAFLALKARFEEQLLTARYPDYAEYKRKSWGLVPGLHW